MPPAATRDGSHPDDFDPFPDDSEAYCKRLNGDAHRLFTTSSRDMHVGYLRICSCGNNQG
jgi:hypothetical protein